MPKKWNRVPPALCEDEEEFCMLATGTPWMPVNPNHTVINAGAELTEPDSVFACYRQLIARRKQDLVFVDGDFTLLEPEHP